MSSEVVVGEAGGFKLNEVRNDAGEVIGYIVRAQSGEPVEDVRSFDDGIALLVSKAQVAADKKRKLELDIRAKVEEEAKKAKDKKRKEEAKAEDGKRKEEADKKKKDQEATTAAETDVADADETPVTPPEPAADVPEVVPNATKKPGTGGSSFGKNRF